MAAILKKALIFVFICFFIHQESIWIAAESEIFCSIAEMKTLFNIDEKIPDLLDKYIQAEETRLEKIVQTAEKFHQSRFSQFNDSEIFLNNPINIFHLIKRFSVDLRPVIKLIETSNIDVFTKTTDRGKNFPDDDDLNGVAIGINRLMLTYNLSMSSLVAGKISPRSKSEETLSAHDCYQIALELYNKKFFDLSLPWFEEALRMESNEGNKTVKRTLVLDFLSYVHFKLGNNTKAYENVKEILQIDPTHIKAKKNELYYKSAKPTRPVKKILSAGYMKINNNYIKLCNEELKNVIKSSNLRCYMKSSSPYLLLQPAKIEDLHLKPWVALLHDVIRENDIKRIQNVALPLLIRSYVGSNAERVDYRISKIAWLRDYQDSAILNLSRRLEDITGLDVTKGSEALQVNNYGIGGHYEPHSDFSKNISHIVRGAGNRIATILIYMNDVIAGGGTVFPNLNISVSPIKGSAVFWHNLYLNGEGDELTLHAACPVLAGAKWVCNKWISQYPQMFRRRCGLRETDQYEK